MYKIKMIGPKYLFASLQSLGIEIFPADSEREAELGLDKAAARTEPSLIFICEYLAAPLAEKIDRFNQKPEINIVLIPDTRKSTGIADEHIKSLIKKSIGAALPGQNREENT